jgi:predicted transcriptional regulator
MRDDNVGPVPVVSDLHEKKLLGIVTDRDLAVHVVAEGRDPKTVRVEEIMSRKLVNCKAEDDYEKALELMGKYQVRRIPVVDQNGLLVGIISQADVARRNAGQAGDVVEEISQPGGIRQLVGSRLVPTRGAGMPKSAVLTSVACLGLGALIGYMLGPGSKTRH